MYNCPTRSAAEEMKEECRIARQNLVFVVDRFYSSTLAFSLATGATGATAGSVEEVEKEWPGLMDWPGDLVRPRLQLTLVAEEEEEERRERVEERKHKKTLGRSC